MGKILRKKLIVIGSIAIALMSAFIAQNVYASTSSDDCERSKDICTPASGSVCYYWLDEPGLPCVVSEYEYIDRNDNENEQGGVNR